MNAAQVGHQHTVNENPHVIVPGERIGYIFSA